MGSTGGSTGGTTGDCGSICGRRDFACRGPTGDGVLPEACDLTYPRPAHRNIPSNPDGRISNAHDRGKNLPLEGEKRLGASPNRFPGCVLEVVLKY